MNFDKSTFKICTCLVSRLWPILILLLRYGIIIIVGDKIVLHSFVESTYISYLRQEKSKQSRSVRPCLYLLNFCSPSVTAVLRDAYCNIFLKFSNRQCACAISHFLGTSKVGNLNQLQPTRFLSPQLHNLRTSYLVLLRVIELSIKGSHYCIADSSDRAF